MRLQAILASIAVIAITLATIQTISSQKVYPQPTKLVYVRWFGKGERFKPAKRLK